MLGPGGISGNEWQVDLGLCDRRQLHLGLFRRLEQALQRLGILAQVDPVGFLELVGQEVDEATVEIVTPKVGVARRGPHLDHAISDVQDADVKRATAKVENEHGLVGPFVHPIGEGGGRRFIYDAEHFEPGDPARVLGCLPLGIVEIGGHGNNRLGHPLTQELGCVVDEFSQHQGRDFLRCVEPAVNGEPDSPVGAWGHVEGNRLQLALYLVVVPADKALGGIDSSFGVQDRLSTRQLTDQALSLLRERHHRGRRP